MNKTIEKSEAEAVDLHRLVRHWGILRWWERVCVIISAPVIVGFCVLVSPVLLVVVCFYSVEKFITGKAPIGD